MILYFPFPRPGATITIKDHPDIGWTLSRDDGWFDMAVDGDGLMTPEYRMNGRIVQILSIKDGLAGLQGEKKVLTQVK